MTPDEILEKRGYTKEENERVIFYSELLGKTQYSISFDKEEKTVTVSCAGFKDDGEFETKLKSLDMEELEAIYRKAKELNF